MGHISEVAPLVVSGGAEVSLRPLPCGGGCMLLGWLPGASSDKPPLRKVTEKVWQVGQDQGS